MRLLSLMLSALMAMSLACTKEPIAKAEGFAALSDVDEGTVLLPATVVPDQAKHTPTSSSTLVAVPAIKDPQTPTKAEATKDLRRVEVHIRRPLRLSVAKMRNGDDLLEQLDEAVLPRFDLHRLKSGEKVTVWLKGTEVVAFRLPSPAALLAMKWGTEFFDERGLSLDGPLLSRPLSAARVTSAYGTRFHPVLKKQRRHQGVDFGAKIGTPIFAVGDGKVRQANRTTFGGNTLRLDHEGKYSSAYMHLDSFAAGVRVGSAVRRGQTIGYVGETGRVTGPHLHYELRLASVLVDPVKWKASPLRALGPSEKARLRAAMSALP